MIFKIRAAAPASQQELQNSWKLKHFKHVDFKSDIFKDHCTIAWKGKCARAEKLPNLIVLITT